MGVKNLNPRSKFQMVPTDCEVIERQTEDTLDKKSNKPVRTITTTQKCKLIKKPFVNEGKRVLTKSLLKAIISEEMEAFGIGVRKGRETRRERHKRVFGDGVDELTKLAHGITEEDDGVEWIRVHKPAFLSLLDKAGICLDKLIQDEMVIDEKCEDTKVGNRLHKSDGTWGSKSDNTSWSLQYQGCGANQMTPGSNKRKWVSLPCGKKAREQGRNVPCKGKTQ